MNASARAPVVVTPLMDADPVDMVKTPAPVRAMPLLAASKVPFWRVRLVVMRSESASWTVPPTPLMINGILTSLVVSVFEVRTCVPDVAPKVKDPVPLLDMVLVRVRFPYIVNADVLVDHEPEKPVKFTLLAA